MTSLPLIDLAPFFSTDDAARLAVAAEWDAAMQDYGMATLVGHGLPQSVMQVLYDSALSFFTLPMERKMAYCLNKGYGSGGYVPPGVEAVSRSHAHAEAAPDLVENIVFSKGGGDGETVMPSEPPSLSEDVQLYFSAASSLLHTLMNLSALALSLPSDYFAPHFAQPETHLRLAYYPPVGASPESRPSGSSRYGAHTDYTGFTILRQDPRVPGLEVQTVRGEWAAVAAVEGGLVVNAGDLIQVWTNDRWRSPPHRVSVPPAGTASEARLSLVFFTGPESTTMISPLPTCCSEDVPAKYAPVSAREHLLSKLQRSNV
uniref:Fe2OG dioxygenase domain-containing protein n=1 Tax=Calcidiscus leptoporus TaxID=127549 RepID=A0A7S0JJA6_9EUKA|mmetsp:Transcript_6477/g.14972  ORF Transcript_6477/g.14972 Transcript_6477/m.14972 type:complete len:316 (+) Transcript_6477:617-1564(+)